MLIGSLSGGAFVVIYGYGEGVRKAATIGCPERPWWFPDFVHPYVGLGVSGIVGMIGIFAVLHSLVGLLSFGTDGAPDPTPSDLENASLGVPFAELVGGLVACAGSVEVLSAATTGCVG